MALRDLIVLLDGTGRDEAKLAVFPGEELQDA